VPKKLVNYIYIINLIIIVKVQHADGDARGRGEGRQAGRDERRIL